MLLYKHYDQQSLDQQFNNRLHVPEFQDYFDRWELLSRQAEEQLPLIKDIDYGTLPRERLDIFPSLQPGSKTLVFIHGGYWQMLDKAMFRFISKGFHLYGITVVLLNYPLAPQAPIETMVQSCRNAFNWIYKNISSYNGNPNEIYVAGHSAGAHLAAMMMTTDWRSISSDLPANLLKGSCLISGLFNLVPIHLCYLNQVLQLNLQSVRANSPVQMQPLNRCPLLIAVGSAETTEFNDQSIELYAAWKEKIGEIQLEQLDQLNHYSVIETIIHPNSPLHHQMRKLM